MDISASDNIWLPYSAQETAFMVIDIQEQIIKAIPDVLAQATLLESIHIALEVSREAGVEQIMLFEQNPLKLGKFPSSFEAWCKKHPPYEKVYFSAMRGTQGACRRKELKEKNIKHVIVTGVESHICVFQTVQDLLSLGYAVTVPIEATLSIYHQDYASAVKTMRQMGARVISLESLLFDLVEHYTSPAFSLLRKKLKKWRESCFISSPNGNTR